jgi:hypothetical protein
LAFRQHNVFGTAHRLAAWLWNHCRAERSYPAAYFCPSLTSSHCGLFVLLLHAPGKAATLKPHKMHCPDDKGRDVGDIKIELVR